jgi:hypothetical protein
MSYLNFRFTLLSILFLMIVLPPSLVNAVDIDPSRSQDQETDFVPDLYREILPALGIDETFGRWIDVVKLGYNPAGAPDAFADAELFLKLLTESAQRWEKVSGIRFEILPAGNYVNDRSKLRAERDGVVSITWVETDERFAGRAGPLFGSYDDQLKYYPYVDGTITLNSKPTWSGADRLTRVLVHEIGHLIGLGHSENPQSLMFANPYNSLQHPTEDDIRAVQTLYGPPLIPIYASRPVTAWQYRAPNLASETKLRFLQEQHTLNSWRYTPPKTAPEAKTQYLFKPNQHSSIYGKGVMLALDSDREKAVTRISGTEPENSYLILYAPIGNWAAPESIDINARLILVNPLGLVHYERSWRLNCEVRFACYRSVPLNWNRLIKDIPGEWHIYVIEDPDSYTSPELLYRMTFTVDGDTRRKPMFSSTYLSVGETELVSNQINESTPENEWFRVNFDLNNVWSPRPIETTVELSVVDPNGYLYSKTIRDLNCGAVRTCVGFRNDIVETEVLKTLPGSWSIYINDTDTDELLHKMEFVVDTNPVFNKSPTARVVVSAADHPNRIRVKVLAEDAEGDTISVVWSQFGNPEVLGADGISQWKTFDFGGSGARTLFIQINDDSERYAGPIGPGSAAGSGFQTLIRLDLTFPLTSSDHVAVTSSSVFVNNDTTSDLLSYMPQYTPSNVPPVVAITGGNRTVADTNGVAGEAVSLTATATDSDGTIATTQWLINGQVVATGTSATIALPDGATMITFRATDNSGATTSTTAVITVENYDKETTSWLGTYNSVAPDAAYQLEVNSVGLVLIDRFRLHSCVRIFDKGIPVEIFGSNQIDVTFDILSFDEGIMQLIDSRMFAGIGQLENSFDCSGSFEISTGIYHDYIKLGDQLFDAQFLLIDEVGIVFMLIGGDNISRKN